MALRQNTVECKELEEKAEILQRGMILLCHSSWCNKYGRLYAVAKAFPQKCSSCGCSPWLLSRYVILRRAGEVVDFIRYSSPMTLGREIINHFTQSKRREK